jgi:NAD(P)-dependent dehydrogenase (short-subunit alcohol dehydrogenase family)
MHKIEGKVSIITGAGSGIGQAAAVLFAARGAAVALAGRTRSALEETEAEIRAAGGTCAVIPTDVSSEHDVSRLVEETVATFGGLDWAFNCGGIDGKKAGLTETTLDDWEEIIGINLTGTFLLMKHQIPAMLARGGGAIVNMASITSQIVRPARCAYNTSRHGVVGLTKSAALEYASRGIRVNAVGPGSVRTAIFSRSTRGDPSLEKAYADAHPIGRIAEPEEIAEVAYWLCAEAPAIITGHTLMADGGFTLQ